MVGQKYRRRMDVGATLILTCVLCVTVVIVWSVYCLKRGHGRYQRHRSNTKLTSDLPFHVLPPDINNIHLPALRRADLTSRCEHPQTGFSHVTGDKRAGRPRCGSIN